MILQRTVVSASAYCNGTMIPSTIYSYIAIVEEMSEIETKLHFFFLENNKNEIK